ncbi:MAG: hypothetical protein ACMUIE_08370 [Thermoplasmatota archaeon]
MGILDDIEKLDVDESLKGTLKRIERLEEENQKLLREILKILKSKKSGKPPKRRDE